MRIVVLWFDPDIEQMLREVLELEGYAVVATRDAGEAVRALDEEEGDGLLLADNVLMNPAAREALARLAVTPALRGRVRVIGIGSRDTLRMSKGQVDMDGYVAMPFTVAALLATVEANVAPGSGECVSGFGCWWACAPRIQRAGITWHRSSVG